ncbi:hypothetical protein Plhal304r1_c012g0047881 [Plasmopara halstedii]
MKTKQRDHRNQATSVYDFLLLNSIQPLVFLKQATLLRLQLPISPAQYVAGQTVARGLARIEKDELDTLTHLRVVMRLEYIVFVDIAKDTELCMQLLSVKKGGLQEKVNIDGR